MTVQTLIDQLNAAINSGKIKPTDSVTLITDCDDEYLLEVEVKSNVHDTWVNLLGDH